jgi:hypothetical protein
VLTSLPVPVRAELQTGQLLRDALIDLNEQGAALLFSSELVRSDMRVVQAPVSADLLEMARELLAPHGLALEPGPGGRWLVTRSMQEPAQSANTGESMPSRGSPEPAPRIDEVLVVASHYRIYGDDQVAEFDHGQIDRLPHLADDLMRAISRLPAVAADDFSAQINLRGGTREETAVYLDGLELIDPFHLKDLQGALSIVDSNLVDRVDVLPGGFPAIYGDRASGMVNIHTLLPPDENVHSLGVSFVNAFANTRGSFNDGQGGWLLSVRRGYLDWLFQLIDTGQGEFIPRYFDLLAKIEHDLGDRHVLSGHILVAEDDLTYLDDSEGTELAGNASSLFLWIRLASRWTDVLTSETVLWRNAIERKRDVGVNDPDDITAEVLDMRDIRMLGIRSDWQRQVGSGWTLGFGFEVVNHEVAYDYSLTGTTNSPAFPGQPPIDRRTELRVNGETLGLHASLRKDSVDWPRNWAGGGMQRAIPALMRQCRVRG